MDRPDFACCGTFGNRVDNSKVLENVLRLAPTTLEVGLMPLELLHPGSQARSQQEIADLVAARNANSRYSSIQIMSSDEMNFLVDTFGQSGMAHNEMFRLRQLLNSENSQTIYLWNDKGYHFVLKLA